MNPTFNLPNANERFVVEEQAPTADNNYKWYRLYNDGWVEQGGYNFLAAYVSNAFFVESLPITMADANYQVLLSGASKSQNFHPGYNFTLFSDNYTTTTFAYCARGGDSRNYEISSSWQVSGYAATAPTYNKIQCIRY